MTTGSSFMKQDAFFLQDILRYSIYGDDIAQQYFYINPDIGLITLKRLLTEGEESQYNVCNISF